MGVTVSHVLSATTPNDPAYEIRPEHWNSNHAITFAQNWQATGNTTQSTSGSGDGMFISGAGIASVGVSNNSLIVSVPAGAPSPVNFSAGTTSNNLGSVIFGDANGVSFGLNGSTITGSHNGLTSQSNQAFSAQGGSSAFQTLNFANANGFTFSNNAGSVQGSYTVPAAFSAGISGGNTSGDTGTVSNQIVFAGGNNITVSGSTNAGGMSVTISGANAGGAQTAISGIVVSDTTYTSGTVSFSNQNGVTIGSSVNGATQYIRLSVAGQSTQPVAVSGSNGSFTYNTLSMGSSNGMHFYSTNGSIVGSYTVPSVPAQTNQTLGLYAVGNTTGESSSSTFDARTLSFHGAGVASVGYSAGSVIVSVPAGGGGLTNINVSAGTTSQNLSNIVFSDSNGVSFGLNGSTITGSVAAGAGVTLTGYIPFEQGMWAINAISNATLRFQPVQFNAAAQFDRIVHLCNYTQASNSTLTVSISYSQGLYTKNGSTMSLAHSMSALHTINGSGTASSTVNNGLRLISFPWTTTIPAGNYYAGVWCRTSTAGANASFSTGILTGRSNFSGMMGEGTNASNQMWLGQGYYSASVTTAIPVSVAFSHLIGSASQHMVGAWFHYTSGTA